MAFSVILLLLLGFSFFTALSKLVIWYCCSSNNFGAVTRLGFTAEENYNNENYPHPPCFFFKYGNSCLMLAAGLARIQFFFFFFWGDGREEIEYFVCTVCTFNLTSAIA